MIETIKKTIKLFKFMCFEPVGEKCMNLKVNHRLRTALLDLGCA